VKLTVTVITFNEAAHIAAALDSVSWADEILVVDSRSTDGTAAIAERMGARVVVRDWPGYGAQKNYAAEMASNDWVLSLDADERVSAGLATEIRDLLARTPARKGYRIPRVTWYLGRWLRSTDWYPDYQLRLYDRRAGRWKERRVHESVELQDSPGTLRHDLQHFAYRDLSHHLATIDRYTTLAAEEWLAEGRRTSAIAAAIHPPFAFLRNYILRGGIRDGSAGLLVSILNSYYVFLKLAKLWELQHATTRKPIADPGPPASRDSGVTENPPPLATPDPPVPESRP
jgi:glycosyltransferase involved in cell wall biosynthesis